MRIWFEKSFYFYDDENIKLSLSWFKHSKKHPYKGFTIHFVYFKRCIIFNYVNNYKLYLETMNRPFKRRELKKVVKND